MDSHLGSLLIVDDNAIVSQVLGLVLGQYCSVQQSRGVVEAKERIGDATPDIVLADFHLTDGLGTHVLEHAREVRPTALRLLMSGAELVELDRWVADGLVAGFLAKPFSSDAFVHLVTSLRAAPAGCAPLAR